MTGTDETIRTIRNWLKRHNDSELVEFCQDNSTELYMSIDSLSYSEKVNRVIDYYMRNETEKERIIQMINEDRQRIQGENLSIREIPVVTMVMNLAQAIELEHTTIEFNPLGLDAAKIQELSQYKSFLQDRGIGEFSPYYDQQRDNWRPYFQDATIPEIIDSIIGRISSIQGGDINIMARFFSEDYFSLDTRVRLDAISTLSNVGGICIIDMISVLHPFIEQKILRSGILSVSKVAILAIHPVLLTPPFFGLTEERLRDLMDMVLYRYNDHLDLLCELGITDITALKRRLLALLPGIKIDTERLNSQSRNSFRQTMGRPNGIDTRIFG